MHERINKIEEMKEKLISAMSSSLDCGVDKVDTKEAGEVIDMIKDLAEAEEKCWKACYYKSIVEAMEAYGDGSERAGYDNWRYASGRFAPTGRGHFVGFVPPTDYIFDDPRMWGKDDGRMGYPRRPGMWDEDGRRMDTDRSTDNSTYGKYRDSRRHYHESGSQSDKDEMSHHAKEYVTEAMATMRDIWKDADPEMKIKMKTELSALAKELGV